MSGPLPDINWWVPPAPPPPPGPPGFSPPPPATVVSNINAIKIDYLFDDGTTRRYYFYGKQDLPPPFGSSNPVPIKATVFYAKNELTTNNIQNVSITGSTVVQPPAIRGVNKSDTTSTVTIELLNPTGVTVYFGFENRAGVALCTITENESGDNVLEDEPVDLHSSSDTLFPVVRGVELTDSLDPTKNYTLTIKHSGTANAVIFDSGFDHPIYVGDIVIHREANARQSIVEHISNDGFINNSFVDDGTFNSITGRDNFVEFFRPQINIADGVSSRFLIQSPTINVRSVEIDNGLGFKKLNPELDYFIEVDADEVFRRTVVLNFVPKSRAGIRIIFDVFSLAIQRKIEIAQPTTFDGRVDRYTDIFVQNEAVYVEINANGS